MRLRRLVLFCAGVALGSAGCGKAGPDVFAEGEALEAQGKPEEAALKFDLTCAYAPKGEKCFAADGRTAEARIKAAEKAIGEGQYLAAERLLTLSLLTADEATAKKATDRLAAEDLTQGLRYQRALTRSSKKDIAEVMSEVAAAKTPAAARAKEWLDKERPGLALARVKAACGPGHHGSCTRAAADLKAAALTGPEVDEALALIDAEERRVYPLRVTAENFLAVFASEGQKLQVIHKCIDGRSPDESEIQAKVRCTDETFPLPDEEVKERNNNNTLFRRLLKSIADPELGAALEERKKKAIDEAKTTKLDLPKPAALKKK